jgi:hypothetical protein
MIHCLKIIYLLSPPFHTQVKKKGQPTNTHVVRIKLISETKVWITIHVVFREEKKLYQYYLVILTVIKRKILIFFLFLYFLLNKLVLILYPCNPDLSKADKFISFQP